MTFNIDDFNRNAVGRMGFLRPCNFVVEIATPKCLMGRQEFARERMLYLCHSAAIPGINISTSDDRRYGLGAVTKAPYDVVLDDVQFSFLVDSNEASALDFMHAWIGSIVGQTHSMDIASGSGMLLPGTVNYKDEYATTINIIIYHNGNTPDSGEMVRITLYEAFPTTLSQVQLDWATSDDIMRIMASFTYRAFRVTVSKANEIMPMTSNYRPEDGFSPFGFAADLGSAYLSRGRRGVENVIRTRIGLEAPYLSGMGGGWANYMNPFYDANRSKTLLRKEAMSSARTTLISSIASGQLFSNVNVQGILGDLFSAATNVAQLSIVNKANSLLSRAF